MTLANGLNVAIKGKAKRSKDQYKSLRSLRKKKAHSNRTCRVCGKDPYPNYFFCPSCHYKVSTYEE